MKVTSLVGNSNYAVTAFKVPKIHKMANSDKLYVMNIFGSVAVVDESWVQHEGKTALFFPAESKISEKILKGNNMYSDSAMNNNPEKKGYFTSSGRVKAVKLRGTISNAFVALPSILEPISFNHTQIAENEVFDTIDGVTFVEKYIPFGTKVKSGAVKKDKELAGVNVKFIPEHISTEHYLRNEMKVSDWDILYVTQKLHGTSIRIAHAPVEIKKTWKQKIAKFLGIKTATHEHKMVYASRKVVKNSNDLSDLWVNVGRRYASQIPKNFVVYGEVVGFEPNTNKAIQSGHTYDETNGACSMYVYRVSFINNDGYAIDLSWPQVKQFCVEHGMMYTPELWSGKKRDFSIEDFDEKDFYAEYEKDAMIYHNAPVKLSKGGTGKDEGVCIRVDKGMMPSIYKYKNKSHILFETKQLDENVVDLESTES